MRCREHGFAVPDDNVHALEAPMRRRLREGITVLELVIVLVIIGLLLLIFIPRFTAPALVGVTVPDSVVAGSTGGDIAVRVTSRSGTPQRGTMVQFEAAGVGSVAPAEAETDSTGTAHATWHASADSGTMRIVAHLAGKTTPSVTMTSRVKAAPRNLTSTPSAPSASVDSTKAQPAQTPAKTPATKTP
jgi:hypothetical protein